MAKPKRITNVELQKLVQAVVIRLDVLETIEKGRPSGLSAAQEAKQEARAALADANHKITEIQSLMKADLAGLNSRLASVELELACLKIPRPRTRSPKKYEPARPPAYSSKWWQILRRKG